MITVAVVHFVLRNTLCCEHQQCLSVPYSQQTLLLVVVVVLLLLSYLNVILKYLLMPSIITGLVSFLQKPRLS